MRRFVPYFAALVAVAVTTLLIQLAVGRTPVANLSMLYLVAVLVVAVAYGRTAAIAASILAFLPFDWFFVPPTHQLVVADPEEVFSLALFLITAVVTGTLAARERARANEARRGEFEATLLYEAAFRIATEPDLDRALSAVAEHFRAALDLDALGIEVDPESLARPVIADRDDTSREALRSTGTEISTMEPPGASRRVRIVGPRAITGDRAPRVRVVPISVSANSVEAAQGRHRSEVRHLGRSEERMLASSG